MGVDLRRPAHILWFVVIIPLVSVGVAWLSFRLIGIAKGYSFLLDGLGVLGAYSLLYKVFDVYAWKWRGFRWAGVVTVPVMVGRWKGTLETSREGAGTQPAIVEIQQTFGQATVHMYFEQSRSFSVMTQFVSEGNGTWGLHYEYENVPRATAAETMHTHFGTAHLECIPGAQRLEGEYYNRARDGRGYVGRMTFEWLGKQLLHRFAE